MALALIQRGIGSALVVCAGPMPKDDEPWGLPPAALKALGPMPCVVGMNARGAETMEQIMAFAKEKRGGRPLWLAALVGFSAGCQQVRRLWLAGASALALVLADGLHAHKPADPWQIAYARDIVARARRGALCTIIEHTYIQVAPDITSTSEMARTVTGWPLAPPPLGATVRRVEPAPSGSPSWAGLAVYSTGSGAYDKPAHEAQALRVLPLALAGRVRELVELPDRPAVADLVPSAAPPVTAEPVAEVVLEPAGAPSTRPTDGGALAPGADDHPRRRRLARSGPRARSGSGGARRLHAPHDRRAVEPHPRLERPSAHLRTDVERSGPGPDLPRCQRRRHHERGARGRRGRRADRHHPPHGCRGLVDRPADDGPRGRDLPRGAGAGVREPRRQGVRHAGARAPADARSDPRHARGQPDLGGRPRALGAVLGVRGPRRGGAADRAIPRSIALARTSARLARARAPRPPGAARRRVAGAQARRRRHRLLARAHAPEPGFRPRAGQRARHPPGPRPRTGSRRPRPGAAARPAHPLRDLEPPDRQHDAEHHGHVPLGRGRVAPLPNAVHGRARLGQRRPAYRSPARLDRRGSTRGRSRLGSRRHGGRRRRPGAPRLPAQARASSRHGSSSRGSGCSPSRTTSPASSPPSSAAPASPTRSPRSPWRLARTRCG